MNIYECTPIGLFHSIEQERYSVARQAGITAGNHGIIKLNRGYNFEQALEGLEGFERIWVIYRFHRNYTWKPKVQPPRETKKKGVFATRSPHRPNFIGMSCVELGEVQGLELTIRSHDLLDGTPILDIKPYLVYADAYPTAKQGWLEDFTNQEQFNIEISATAQRQFDYLKEQWDVEIFAHILARLAVSPFPNSKNRIRNLTSRTFEIAYKTWRVSYTIEGNQILLEKIYSGYDAATLAGHRNSRWDDVPIHIDFAGRLFA